MSAPEQLLRLPGKDACRLALDNPEAVLAAADMTLAKHFGGIVDRFGDENRFATSLPGVAQLPGQLLVMLEASAVD